MDIIKTQQRQWTQGTQIPKQSCSTIYSRPLRSTGKWINKRRKRARTMSRSTKMWPRAIGTSKISRKTRRSSTSKKTWTVQHEHLQALKHSAARPQHRGIPTKTSKKPKIRSKGSTTQRKKRSSKAKIGWRQLQSKLKKGKINERKNKRYKRKPITTQTANEKSLPSKGKTNTLTAIWLKRKNDFYCRAYI